jgi:hypothetical protein
MNLHSRLALAAALLAALAPSAFAQSSTSSSSHAFRSSAGLGGHLYFSSPAAAYLNSSFMRGSDAQQVEAVKRESAARRARQGGSAAAARPGAQAMDLRASEFRPVVGERSAVIDGLVAGRPAGPQREQMRSLIATLSDRVERTPGWQNNSLAQATYVLASLSLGKVTGVPIDASRTREIVQGINDAYAGDPAFRALSDAERSRVYYLYVATIALTAALCDSKDPNEARQGQALARNTLRSLGIKTPT